MNPPDSRSCEVTGVSRTSANLEQVKETFVEKPFCEIRYATRVSFLGKSQMYCNEEESNTWVRVLTQRYTVWAPNFVGLVHLLSSRIGLETLASVESCSDCCFVANTLGVFVYASLHACVCVRLCACVCMGVWVCGCVGGGIRRSYWVRI